MEKNTGKTECLKHVLSHLDVAERCVAVTSIGIDGEHIDQVTLTQKPEIELRPGLLFATSETHYRQRRLLAELLDVSDEHTALGRVVTARALSEGKVLLSGPSSTAGLRRWMRTARALGAELTIADGALSRLSSASPAVSEAMILATGAACSPHLPTLVERTAHVVRLIGLPLAEPGLVDVFAPLEHGVWWLRSDGSLHALEGPTALTASFSLDGLDGCQALYVAGALTGSLIERLRQHKQLRTAQLVVRDFTKVFITPQQLRQFDRGGGWLTVLQRSRLLAITVNPTSPSGFTLDSDRLCEALAQATLTPSYDLLAHQS